MMMKELDLVELEERANDGDYEACFELARRYREGDGVEVNIELSNGYTQFGKEFGGVVEQKTVEVQPIVQNCYEDRMAKAKNMSLLQLQKGEERGDIFAIYALAHKYLDNSEYKDKGFQKLLTCENAIKEQLKTSNQDDIHKLFIVVEDEIGRCYETGNGIEQSSALAFEHYSNAYEFEESHTEEVLRCYENGIGVTRNPDKAREIKEKEISRKGIVDKYNYAMTLLGGDHFYATTWFQTALDADDANQHYAYRHAAQYQLALLHETDEKGNALDEQKELNWLSNRRSNGDPETILLMYENGLLEGKEAYSDALKDVVWVNTYDYVSIENDLNNVYKNSTGQVKEYAENALNHIHHRMQLKQDFEEKANRELDRKTMFNVAWDKNDNPDEMRMMLEQYLQYGTQEEKSWAQNHLPVLDNRNEYTKLMKIKNSISNDLSEDKRMIPWTDKKTKYSAQYIKEELNKYIYELDKEKFGWVRSYLKVLEEREKMAEHVEFKAYVEDVLKFYNTNKYNWSMFDSRYKNCMNTLNYMIEHKELGYTEWAKNAAKELQSKGMGVFCQRTERSIQENPKGKYSMTANQYHQYERALKEYMQVADEDGQQWAKKKLKTLAENYEISDEKKTTTSTKKTAKSPKKQTRNTYHGFYYWVYWICRILAIVHVVRLFLGGYNAINVLGLIVWCFGWRFSKGMVDTNNKL